MERVAPGIQDQSLWFISPRVREDALLPYQVSEAGKFYAEDSFRIHIRKKTETLFLYTCSGEGEISVDGKRETLCKNTLLVVDQDQEYRLALPEGSGEPWVFSWLYLGAGRNDVYCKTILAGSGQVVIRKCAGLSECFEDVLENFQDLGATAYLRLNSNIVGLLSKAVDLKTRRTAKRCAHKQIIHESAAYIRQKYDRIVDVDELADLAGLSKYYYIKLFKEHTRLTPYEYVINQRIIAAKKLLYASDLKVAEVSETVGFNDECNFIRTFKRITGVTPLQYRERCSFMSGA